MLIFYPSLKRWYIINTLCALYLIISKGYEVIGVTLRTWQSDTGEDSRCCEIDDARAIARQIGISYYAFGKGKRALLATSLYIS